MAGSGTPQKNEPVDAPDAGTDPAPEAASTETEEQPSVLLSGLTVAPGLALGTAHRKDYDLSQVGAERVALDEIDRELNRLRRALDESRVQLEDLKTRLRGRVHEEDARILDTHIAYLKDSVFIADVENLVLNEQMRLEAAIAKVISDFDRIFRLVQNDTLRQSAVDLRDVGIRVLRNLERHAAAGGDDETGPREYVLVAKELSIVDMFNLSNEHVKGIVTQEGSLTSHAATFARSMGIPTLTGVEGLLDTVQEGDFVILDGTEGLLRVNPDELVRAQFASTTEQADAPGEGPVPAWAVGPYRLKDGEAIEVLASAGNLPDVEQAAALGLDSVGLYRTELLYLVDPAPPSREALVRHYATVLEKARGGPVTFRLLSVDAGLRVRYLHSESDLNPALGRVGVRALLANEKVLRRQIQAILIAGVGHEVSIAVPFVTDCGELRRVKEVLFEERLELKREGLEYLDHVSLGSVIEVPAAMLGVRDFAAESDFLYVNLDSFEQYLLATDRENAVLSRAFDRPHPFVLRALQKMCAVAASAERRLTVFGVLAARPETLPLFVGIGLRRFCVAPSNLERFLAALRDIDGSRASAAAHAAARASCPAETESLVAGFRHGYAKP